ncbi:hypothetical protein [Pararhodobacter sp. CCB-MM2]|uniref:hypothetical protein n=1 Tax=Pararhodobacter sp. CCB-MM2 TaxID=1786003 RepID=UPI00082B7892|nr:hypothetical protein [Pararhodobacter sp. CCB-MM2]
MDDLPVAGRFFEDIIDGYFPLGESLRQMLHRQGFGAALVVITHAPLLHFAGDDGAGPVPMRLQRAAAGLLRGFFGLAVREGEGLRLTGVADWQWPENDLGFSTVTRLAEPAFLRGIGLEEGPLDAGAFGKVVPDETSGLAIAGPQAPGWGFARVPEGIERDVSLLSYPGKTTPGSGPRLRVTLADGRHSDASRVLAQDLMAGFSLGPVDGAGHP